MKNKLVMTLLFVIVFGFGGIVSIFVSWYIDFVPYKRVPHELIMENYFDTEMTPSWLDIWDLNLDEKKAMELCKLYYPEWLKDFDEILVTYSSDKEHVIVFIYYSDTEDAGRITFDCSTGKLVSAVRLVF